MIADTRKLRILIAEPEVLLSYLSSLSHSRFRHASSLLADYLLVECNTNEFWQVFSTLFQYDRKAYLGTLLKALSNRIRMQDLDEGIFDEPFLSLCNNLTEVDRKKVLLTLLPLLNTPDQVRQILLQCGLSEAKDWIPFLVQVPTSACAFILLKSLRYVEHDRALLIRTCHFLMKKGDEKSFNLASLLRLSFGLDEVRGTFSLSLEPYQLSRIEHNYESFLMQIW